LASGERLGYAAGMPIDLLHDGPEDAPARLVLAHGAGAPMTSSFMQAMAEALGDRGIRVTRFEFPYMQGRRYGGKRGGPDKQPVLLDTYREVIALLGSGEAKAKPEKKAAPLFIGGKSMGGRMASMIADEAGVRGLVCLGYPFHPARKPAQLRVAHLKDLKTPALIVQGTRDELGSREDVAGYELSGSIRFEWIEDGDHSFERLKRSGRTTADAMAQAIDAVASFVLAP
jgi:predicted alpha/beta-hydrolase family hydrolase